MSKSASSPPPTPSSATAKKKPEDFIFGKVIGEGSFSTVFLAKEVSTGKEYAIKVLEKRLQIREKKTKYVMREKEVFSKLNHPFFIRLYYTFQDTDRLYFVLSYAKGGELLDYINKLGCFDEKCTRFYTAELVSALEHLHSLGIIHRDLKPENILLNEQMHIQITDFGSAKILQKADDSKNTDSSENTQDKERRNSFVGTAQYVSPEILTSKNAYYGSDLWALGCIIYQLLSGQVPFWGGHEYQIFQKIIKVQYEFPDGFNSAAKDLVERLLVLEPTQRLGAEDRGGYAALKAHKFLENVNWDNLQEQKAPELVPYLPAKAKEEEDLWSQYKAGLDDQHLSRLIGINLQESQQTPTPEKEVTQQNPTKKWISNEERERRMKEQISKNDFNRFVEGNLIIKQGLVDKRKGLFARRRMLLLTEGPHLYYVDPQNMVLKGEIPWSNELKPEAKNFKIYFVHTPNRTYYLEDPQGNALKWCKEIEEVWEYYYGNKT